ncbi:helix-turn-helix transcriptional regulator [Aquimarina spongiae]|uniref:AraC-type DNA-binding protein n=1 Tax=Aquimarina spongiae TaxID=570521 RepID=A0A1M6GLZ9_9FLAO|nr:AraC family transcriptional regulator [Aquimarina spongiae]SHJ10963.1 AraC-type DNA-binding protein [Aquimarina spongiae]
MSSFRNDIPPEFFQFQELLEGVLEKKYDTYSIIPNKQVGTGKVRFINLQYGLQSFDFDLTPSQDLEIPIKCITFTSLQFLYCLEGSCSHQFDDLDKVHTIEQFQTAVIHTEQGLVNRIFVKAGERLVLNILVVNKKEYFAKFDADSNKFERRIQDLLRKIGTRKRYYHSGGHSLKIAEQLKLLIGIEYANEISEMLSQRGRYYLVLARHIEKFCQEVGNNQNTSGLLKNELKEITITSDYIKTRPEDQHTIKTLCARSGLSPAKLQEGFKFMFNRTVSDFIRNVRLEQAEKLIRTTDLTISEVTYSVGLTSRSYFCKIFKKRYNYSPKEYKIKCLRYLKESTQE